ncbi:MULTISPECIES: hypothetical protein [unclassified Lentimonas]|uniref:hypothetical protein n=1 Tax=unclassified Lentimonas TaxID=2630993 RepID=UPI00132CA797|nr:MULTISPECIES: hypothetical protein [unclassified Lentimonas]CAA6693081.1 Unannotated [Lentimonas sp. CC19]CAA6695694.1 Unannotated [Lentimonas sp. CC10]CAA7071536.1 Unannotated [Lentimonas sp. CC11]
MEITTLRLRGLALVFTAATLAAVTSHADDGAFVYLNSELIAIDGIPEVNTFAQTAPQSVRPKLDGFWKSAAEHPWIQLPPNLNKTVLLPVVLELKLSFEPAS